jgi:alkaline phosphatase D
MQRLSLVFSVCLLVWTTTLPAGEGEPWRRIAFGSCAKQDRPQPIWEAVVAARPQAFLFLGDNIYGDSEDVEVLRAKWKLLAAQPGLQALRRTTPILATWDDHDFGVNDGGADYPRRRESQQLLLDFLGVPADDPRRAREGVYHAEVHGPPGRRVQVILLDARYHRSPLRQGFENGEPGEGHRGRYVPNNDPDATVLGSAQWAWLEAQLKVPAEVRLICSGVQVLPDEHGWEKWGNFPRERQRLLALIRGTGAQGVVFLSGDRHLAEISRLPGGHPDGVGYPLWEVTSSSLNTPSGNLTGGGVRFANERNSLRMGLTWFETNFGTIDIDWSAAGPLLRLQVRDEQGGVVLQQRVSLSELQPDVGR